MYQDMKTNPFIFFLLLSLVPVWCLAEDWTQGLMCVRQALNLQAISQALFFGFISILRQDLTKLLRLTFNSLETGIHNPSASDSRSGRITGVYCQTRSVLFSHVMWLSSKTGHSCWPHIWEAKGKHRKQFGIDLWVQQPAKAWEIISEQEELSAPLI